MSRLEYYSRPWVAFDASNKEHRRYYAEFLKFNTWGRCPVRFLITDEHGMDLPTMLRNKLCEYYVAQEFKNEKMEKRSIKQRKVIGLTFGGKGAILQVQ
jgi:hypothetical protein